MKSLSKIRNVKVSVFGEYLIIIVLLLLFTIALYPKVFFKDHIISSADFLYLWEPWDSLKQQPYASKNYVMSDQPESLYPIFEYLYSQVKQGEFPMWYGLTGMGSSAGITFLPFFVLNPFIIISTFLSLTANVGSVMTISFILLTLFRGIFTYALLREFKLGKIPAFLGAVIFSFTLYNIVWGMDGLVYVSSIFPFLLWTVELLFKEIKKLNILLFLVALILLVFGAFPSTILYVISFIGLYILARSVKRLINKVESLKTIAKRLLVFLIIGIISFGLMAFILFPTIEIFTNKIDLSYREDSHSGRFYDRMYLLRYFIPDLLGNPINYNWQNPPFQPTQSTNYSESAMYVGAFSMFLCCFSLIRGIKDKKIIFFAAATLLTILIMFDIGPFLKLINLLPLFSSNPSTRLSIIPSMYLAILAAYGLDIVMNLKGNKYSKIYFLAVVAIAVNITGGILLYTTRITDGFMFFDERVILEVGKYLFFIINGFFIAYLITLKEIKSVILPSVLVLLIFIDLFITSKNYLPEIKKEDYFPSTESIQYLQEKAKEDQFRILPFDEVFLSASPAYYGLNSITLLTHYDQRWVEFTNMIQDGAIGLARQTVRFKKYKTNLDSQVIDFANIKYILDHKDARPLWEDPIAENKDFNDILALEQGDVIEQTFSTEGATDIKEISFRINDIKLRDGTVLKTEILDQDETVLKTYRIGDISSGMTSIRDTVDTMDLPSEGDYKLRISWESPTSNKVELSTANIDLYTEGEVLNNGVIQKGDLTFSVLTNNESLKDKYELVYGGEVKIYENKQAFDRAFLVHDIKESENAGNSLEIFKELVESKSLDKTAVIEAPKEKVKVEECNQISQDSVDITEYKANTVKIKTNSSCDSLLVLTDLYDKDWKVFVNGEQKELYLADYLVRGVYISEGENNIEFQYKPATFVWGSRISIATSIGVIIYALPFRKIFRKK